MSSSFAELLQNWAGAKSPAILVLALIVLVGLFLFALSRGWISRIRINGKKGEVDIEGGLSPRVSNLSNRNGEMTNGSDPDRELINAVKEVVALSGQSSMADSRAVDIDEARRALEGENLNRARIYAQKVLASHAGDTEALVILANVFEAKGDVLSAFKWFCEALKTDSLHKGARDGFDRVSGRLVLSRRIRELNRTVTNDRRFSFASLPEDARALARCIVALSNCGGGVISLGMSVADDAKKVLPVNSCFRYVEEAWLNNCEPTPIVEYLQGFDDAHALVVYDGASKPYCLHPEGACYVLNGRGGWRLATESEVRDLRAGV